jgi:hypothetical protein
MPTVLSDPSPILYVIFAIFVGVLAMVYLRSRKRGDLVRLIGAAAALVALFVIDRLVESPREESTRKMREIVTASKAKKVDDIAKHVSDSFRYNNMNKEQFKAIWSRATGIAEFQGIDVDGLGHSDFEPVDENKVKIGFDVWPTGYGLPQYRYYCKATFVKDPDGQFRMQTFELYPKRGDDRPVVPEQLR